MAEKGNEAQARIKINKLLEKAGWRFFDDKNGKANVLIEDKTLLTKKDFDEFGKDFEKTKKGYLDYLLLNGKNEPFLVIEAKRSIINPLEAQNQAKKYAKSKNVDYIILTNGDIHYLWNLKNNTKEAISIFPSLEEFEKQKNYFEEFENNRSKLLNYAYDEFLIAESQVEGLLRDKSYMKNKDLFVKENNLIKLRDYQCEAINKMRNTIENKKNSFLFEMATGTGKTLVAAAVIKFFLKSGFTNRVLFLVDRIDLEKQALSDFQEYFAGDKVIDIGIYKNRKDNWQNCNILITTIQSLVKEDRYRKHFGRFDFGLIITDEAHRSISGATNRELFKYFVSYKLGLTATPKAFLRNIDETNLLLTKPLELEERRARDTYSIFGCEDGKATFVYDLKRGAEDKILNQPKLVDSKTLITTELLSEKGLEFKTVDEDGNEISDSFFMKHFEKKFVSDKTNLEVCKHFLETAKRDPVTGEIGKTIFFCVSQAHALKITNMLNDLAVKMIDYPKGYEFAKRITSNEEDANTDSKSFNHKHNNLCGNSRVEEKYINYKTSKVRVCVTVSMMSTDYNCCDLLNIVMFRPIYSPAEFIQIKGRGTRLYDFKWESEDGMLYTRRNKKEDFYLFDYFGICDYFDKKYDFEKPEKIVKIKKFSESEGGESKPKITSNEEDKIITSFKKEIGAEGFIVDRQGLKESVVKENFKEDFVKTYEKNNKSKAEEIVLDFLTKRNLDFKQLRYFFKVKREVTIDDVYSFLKNDVVKSDNKYFDEKFEEFYSKYNFREELKDDVKRFFEEYCFNPRTRSFIDSDEISKIGDIHFLNVLGRVKEYKEEIVDYIRDNNLYL